MILRAWPLLMLLLLAGCLECEPLMEVRHCLDDCAASDDAVFAEWTQEDAEMWPAFHALIIKAELGEHEHAKWTSEQEHAFWAHYNVTGDRKELHVTFEGESYRLKVLSCD